MAPEEQEMRKTLKASLVADPMVDPQIKSCISVLIPHSDRDHGPFKPALTLMDAEQLHHSPVQQLSPVRSGPSNGNHGHTLGETRRILR